MEAGIRNSVVEVGDDDHLAAAAGRPADSGVRYGTVSPVAGLTYRAAPHVDLYGSYGKGFETRRSMSSPIARPTAACRA